MRRSTITASNTDSRCAERFQTTNPQYRVPIHTPNGGNNLRPRSEKTSRKIPQLWNPRHESRRHNDLSLLERIGRPNWGGPAGHGSPVRVLATGQGQVEEEYRHVRNARNAGGPGGQRGTHAPAPGQCRQVPTSVKTRSANPTQSGGGRARPCRRVVLSGNIRPERKPRRAHTHGVDRGKTPRATNTSSRMGQVQRPPHFCASELIRTSRIPS